MDKPHVFRLSKSPVKIDTMRKVYVQDMGINPLIYIEDLHFDMFTDEFYDKLYGKNKMDKPDTQLLLFLADFNTK